MICKSLQESLLCHCSHLQVHMQTTTYIIHCHTTCKNCLKSSSGSRCLFCYFLHASFLFTLPLWLFTVFCFNVIIVYNNCSTEDSDVVGYQPLRCDSDDMDGEWSKSNFTKYYNMLWRFKSSGILVQSTWHCEGL